MCKLIFRALLIIFIQFPFAVVLLPFSAVGLCLGIIVAAFRCFGRKGSADCCIPAVWALIRFPYTLPWCVSPCNNEKSKEVQHTNPQVPAPVAVPQVNPPFVVYIVTDSGSSSQTRSVPSLPAVASSSPYSGFVSEIARGNLPIESRISDAVSFGKICFSYEELAAATNDFSAVNIIGKGGYGLVYKGMLASGKEVAVKKLKDESRSGDDNFQAEIDIISHVHHKHLVSLIGYCISNNQKRLLVYEYVSNNTLEFHLHRNGKSAMNWPNRYKVSLGSAKGLAYLHEDCQPKIIHRDIKSANILLNDSFEAKVADFGISKFFLEDETHISTRVIGTFGYLAPEYASTGQLTEKSDVYSFGVMLLELVTGRKPILQPSTSAGITMPQGLVDWARPLLAEALEHDKYDALIDPRLKENYDPIQMKRMIVCAAASVRQSARWRPQMSQIVLALEGHLPLDNLSGEFQSGQSTLHADMVSIQTQSTS
ncbi:proline-rich receptor-like protein kinase PERK4 [Typha latifolia]|uniref:proline-rich receptor-like protein kinase PERK4 n=1 Tax=Typha latifolia TaxID=4733 RepID=UPI003C307B51